MSQPRTHEDEMREFLNFVVDSTKNSSTHHRLETDASELTALVLQDHQTNIKDAARKSRSDAVVFLYALGTQYKNAPVYELMFPNKYLQKQFDRFRIKPVFERVQEFFKPFETHHKIYQITTTGSNVTMKQVELDDNQVHFFTNTGKINLHKGEYVLEDISDDSVDASTAEPEDEIKEKTKIRYVGCITVSWHSYLTDL